MVSTQEGIAIAEISVYIPTLILTIFILLRLGLHRQLGWIYLAIFSVVRIAGAIFEIRKNSNPTNKTDIEWSAILQSVGLSPLLMASLGLLKRVTDEVSNHVRGKGGFDPRGIPIANIITKRATANSRRSRIIQIAQLPTTIALILCIVGGLDESDSSQSEINTGKRYFKIGIIMFLVIYLLLSSLVVVTMKDVGNAPRVEKLIYFAVLAALPFIAVRLLWSILSVFANNSSFSINSPKPLVQLFMATIEEFVVIVFYVSVGLLAARN